MRNILLTLFVASSSAALTISFTTHVDAQGASPSASGTPAPQTPTIDILRKVQPRETVADHPQNGLRVKVVTGQQAPPIETKDKEKDKSGGNGSKDTPKEKEWKTPDPIEIHPDPKDKDEEEDPNKFMGEDIPLAFVWVLDRSGSMSAPVAGGAIEDWNGNVVATPSRITLVKTECIATLRKLTEKNEFAIVTFGANPEHEYYQDLVKGTEANKRAAVEQVMAMAASGWTPAYGALHIACTQYKPDIDKLFFLSDGSPNRDGSAPGGVGDAPTILAAFPGWYAPLKAEGCQLVCIHIGDSMAAGQFMQQLATQNGGSYVKK